MQPTERKTPMSKENEHDRLSDIQKSGYFRANVGVILFKEGGLVAVFERRNQPGAYQFPQGGIDKGEQPIEAVRRELQEELGFSHGELAKLAEFVAESPVWLGRWRSDELTHLCSDKVSHPAVG
jgi:8-oxo-dGTP pyrophosphatase MutT (NUDIX family)